ncbi:M12 family metallo-peptidase [Streptomyces sp. NPDC005706]|uniref:M12 family metallo-peptidase n=1 Tax=Streptomyces sp. NPDC005706 TaxID=3157169 RepID=UPI0033E7C299
MSIRKWGAALALGASVAIGAPSITVGSAQAASADQVAQAVSAGRTIDLLVVYTADAAAEQGGTAGIDQAARASAQSMNDALARSGIDGAVNVVHTEQVDYVESGDQGTDLHWLSGDPAVASLRNQYHADLVSLVVPGVAGVAYKPSNNFGTATQDLAFSVVGGQWLVPEAGTGEAGVFAHELGHNLGADHDWDTSPKRNKAYPYDHGHVTPNGLVDIMAYNTASSCKPNCRRVPYYSNPNITVEGEKFGSIDGKRPSDLARLFNETIPIVATYR